MTRWLIIWCVFAVGLVGSVGDSSANSVATEQSDDIICFTATFKSVGVRVWDKNPALRGFVTEAKRRGLNCGVGLPTSKLGLAFVKKTTASKFKIQTKLSSLGYYNFNVDGLYGKGTRAALKAYNKEYLGDADLTKSANVKALLDDILKEKPASLSADKCQGSNTKSVKCRPIAIAPRDEQMTTTEQVEATEPAAPPLDFPQLKASYDAGNFTQAFREASTLSVEGNPDAQLYLGKMYADGRGTLQVTTSAHMWFNIASMNGSDEAFEERKAIQSQMTAELINEAQKMAVACIKSDYKDCGLLVQPSENEELVVKRFQPTASNLRSYFINQPTLQRKQMQYALKKLGYYKSTVDGLWGKGTRTAVQEYLASDSSVNELDKIYESLTSEVDVPSYFAASVQKKKAATEVVKTQPKFLPSQGYISYGNPTMTVAQALDICKQRAKRIGRVAGNAAIERPPTYTTRCRGSSYSNNFNGRCRTTQDSKYGSDLGTAMAIGILEGLSAGMTGRQAALEELQICMAEVGWKKVN